jgi:hypothetical protein
LSYYEDIGVSPKASPEQIREAYKLLVRLLHPDQHTDPALKRAAEGQMRRINQAYAALADPESRRRYDAELHAPPPERPVSPPLVIRTPKAVVLGNQLRTGLLIWIGAAILSLGALFWLSTQAQSPPAQGRVPPITIAPQATKNMGSPVHEPPPPKAYVSPAPSATPQHRYVPELVLQAQPVTPPPQPEPPTFASPQLPPPEPPHYAQNHFAGFWAYPKEKNFQRQTGQYPPQFIEASISERDGTIHGKYHARYYVSDRPISPNVNFEFEGKPDGGSAKLPWHGEGGSQGQIEIKLLSPGEMELIWQATDFGQTLGLASGTAVLMRRPD